MLNFNIDHLSIFIFIVNLSILGWLVFKFIEIYEVAKSTQDNSNLVFEKIKSGETYEQQAMKVLEEIKELKHHLGEQSELICERKAVMVTTEKVFHALNKYIRFSTGHDKHVYRLVLTELGLGKSEIDETLFKHSK